MANVFCEKCGNPNPADSKFCQKCGNPSATVSSSPVPPAPAKVQPPRPTTAPPPATPRPAQVKPTPVAPVAQPQYTPQPQPQYTPQPQPIQYNAAPQQPNYQQYANAPQNRIVDQSPLSVGEYILMMFLMSLPLIGFILTLVWSFGSDVNPNKKNYARAILIIAIIATVLSILTSLIMVAVLQSMAPMLEEFFKELERSLR